MEHVAFDGGGDAELARECLAIEAGQHGHGKDERPGQRERLGRFPRAVGRRAHHGPAARGVHVEHEDAEPHRFAGGSLHGIRDVVELEVEEDLAPALSHRLDRGGADGGEELRADLEATRRAVEGVHERGRAVEGVHVQGDY